MKIQGHEVVVIRAGSSEPMVCMDGDVQAFLCAHWHRFWKAHPGMRWRIMLRCPRLWPHFIYRSIRPMRKP